MIIFELGKFATHHQDDSRSYLKSNDIYRPQQSCEGYVFTPVCDSVNKGGGVSAQVHAGIYTPPPGPEVDTP